MLERVSTFESSRKIKLTLDGLVVVEPMNRDEWAAQFVAFQEADRAFPFYLGDLLNYAKPIWGDDVWQYIRHFVGQRTAENYGWVCRRFPPAQPIPPGNPDGRICLQHGHDCGSQHFRYVDLTMGHHHAVASLVYVSPADAQAVLKDIATRGLGIREARALADGKRAELKAAELAHAILPPDTPPEDSPLADTARANNTTPRQMAAVIEQNAHHLEPDPPAPRMVICASCGGKGVVPLEAESDG